MSTSRRTLLGAAVAGAAAASTAGLPGTAHAASWQQKWAPSASSAGLGAFETVEDDRADSHTSGQPHIFTSGNNWRFNMHMADRDTSTDRQRQEVTGLRNGSGSNYLKWTSGQTWRVTYSMYIPSSLKATTTFTHIMQMKQPGSGSSPIVVQSLRRVNGKQTIELKLAIDDILIGRTPWTRCTTHGPTSTSRSRSGTARRVRSAGSSRAVARPSSTRRRPASTPSWPTGCAPSGASTAPSATPRGP